MNLADPAAVTLALNINSVAVTLTAQQVQFISCHVYILLCHVYILLAFIICFFTLIMQVTALTALQTRLTIITTRLNMMTTGLQAEFQSLTGTKASIIQIAAGSSTVTDAAAASTTYLVVLRDITVNKQSVTSVEKVLTRLVLSGSLTVEGGEQITGQEFLIRLEMFLAILETDIVSSQITAFSFGLTEVSVSLSEAEITSLTAFQKNIKLVQIKIAHSLAFFKTRFFLLHK